MQTISHILKTSQQSISDSKKIKKNNRIENKTEKQRKNTQSSFAIQV